MMSTDGSDLAIITDYPSSLESSPAWSPDGEQIAFVSTRDGNQEVYLFDFGTAEEIRLTEDPAFDDTPCWSPDGSQIAFTSDRRGNPDIYVMSADGTNQTRLTDNLDLDYAPAWSPDGTRIAFHSERNNNIDIYVMDIDGSNVQRLTTDLAPDMNPTWSPDGGHIAFESTRGEDDTFDLYVVDSTGGNLVRLTTLNADGMLFPAWSPAEIGVTGVLCDTENEQASQLFGEALVLERQGRLREAEQLYRDAIELDPTFCDAMDNLGVLLRQQGEVEEAIYWYTRSIEILPENYTAHQNLGVAYWMQGEMTKAIEEYQFLIELDPNNPEGYYGLGQVYFLSGQCDLALPQLEEAERLYLDQASPYVDDARLILGLCHFDLGDCIEAVDYLEQIYPVFADDPDVNYTLGMCYMSDEIADEDLALTYLARAQELGLDVESLTGEPTELDALDHFAQGLWHHEQGEWDLAIEEYSRAIALDPEFAAAYCSRAVAYSVKGQYEEALADLSMAIEIDATAFTYFLRGVVYAEIGQQDEAISDLETALELGLEQDLAESAEAFLDELTR